MQTNVKPFAEIVGNVKESNVQKTYTSGSATPASSALGMIDGWKSPMFTGK